MPWNHYNKCNRLVRKLEKFKRKKRHERRRIDTVGKSEQSKKRNTTKGFQSRPLVHLGKNKMNS